MSQSEVAKKAALSSLFFGLETKMPDHSFFEDGFL